MNTILALHLFLLKPTACSVHFEIIYPAYVLVSSSAVATLSGFDNSNHNTRLFSAANHSQHATESLQPITMHAHTERDVFNLNAEVCRVSVIISAVSVHLFRTTRHCFLFIGNKVSIPLDWFETSCQSSRLYVRVDLVLVMQADFIG